MIAGYLVALAPFGGVLLVLVIVALCWLALWLLEKHLLQHQRRGEQRNSGDDRPPAPMPPTVSR